MDQFNYTSLASQPQPPQPMMTIDPSVLYDSSMQLIAQGSIEQAILGLKQLVTVIPNHFAAWHQLGECFLTLRQHENAIQAYNMALSYCPDFYHSKEGLARVCLSLNRHSKAIELYQEIIDQGCHDPTLYLSIAQCYQDLGEFTKAQEYRDVILKMRPWDLSSKVYCYLNLPGYAQDEEDANHQCQQLLDYCDELMLHHRAYRATLPGTPNIFPTAIFYLSYFDINIRSYLERFTTLYRTIYPDLNHMAPFVNYWKPKKPGEKIKIGILSAFLNTKNHSVWRIYSNIIEQLTDCDIDITILDCGTSSSPADFKNPDIKIINIPLNLNSARQIMEESKFDVLLYTDIGMELYSYFLAYSRLAPIQCALPGHPITTGLDSIDFYISSKHFESEEAQNYYTEELHLLQSLPHPYNQLTEPTQNPTFTKAYFELPENKTIYSCPQTIFKFHPKMDLMFKKILEKDENGVLVLFLDKDNQRSQAFLKRLQQNLHEHWDKVIIKDYIKEYSIFFQILPHIDVFLDSWPFTGSNTSLQVFQWGKPVVTLPTHSFRGRQTYGYYDIMGIYDCVANSEDDYVDIALKLGKDPTFNKKICKKISQKKNLLFNDFSCVKEYKEFFRKVVYGDIQPRWMKNKNSQ